MLRAQQAVPRLHPRALGAVTRGFRRGAVSRWAFGHYLRIAPPQFALPAPPVARSRAALSRAA